MDYQFTSGNFMYSILHIEEDISYGTKDLNSHKECLQHLIEILGRYTIRNRYFFSNGKILLVDLGYFWEPGGTPWRSV